MTFKSPHQLTPLAAIGSVAILVALTIFAAVHAVELPFRPSLDVRVAGTITVPRRAEASAPIKGAHGYAVTSRASTNAPGTPTQPVSSSFI